MSRLASTFQPDALAVRNPRTVATILTAVHRLVLLLDTSGSMECMFGEVTRLEAARQAILALLAETNRTDTLVALVSFESIARVEVRYTTNFDTIRTHKFWHGGSTDMAAGIITSTDLDPPPTRIVLLSDGAANTKDNTLIAAREAARLGIVIDTIGIGEADATLLQSIAELTGGVYSQALSPLQLRARFAALAPPNRPLLGDSRDVRRS